MDRTTSVVTPERYASGMTFEQYLQYIASPENLRREGSPAGETRRDWSEWMRDWYHSLRLSDAQHAAIRWLAAQPGGPKRILVIGEEWSSDCRRDIPALKRLAEAGGLELRIFRRDGQRFSQSHRPSLAEAPDSNADLMAEFLNDKRGETWQSVPVAVFYTADLQYLYHYIEYPRIYDKDRLVYGHIRVPRAGETSEASKARVEREFGALQASPFFRIWASAAIDEILSALHDRLVLGPRAV
jgi:Thioredoxin